MNVLATKLEQFARLSPDDLAALDALAQQPVITAPARQDIITEGDPPRTVKLLLSGWACRYKLMQDGRREILAFFVPGDLCDLNIFILRQMDHSIAAITPIRYVEIPPEAFDAVCAERPLVMQALFWETLVTVAIQREWTVSVAKRTALERLAHLFCELFFRLRAVGLASEESFPFPVTQADLADAVGLTNVHVNRTLQQLRRGGLIRHDGKQVTILDFEALRETAMFNPNYLHLDGRASRNSPSTPTPPAGRMPGKGEFSRLSIGSQVRSR